jgi:hypothetical protein
VFVLGLRPETKPAGGAGRERRGGRMFGHVRKNVAVGDRRGNGYFFGCGA